MGRMRSLRLSFPASGLALVAALGGLLLLFACGGTPAPARPGITSFAPAATSITVGTSTTLTAVFSDGVGAIDQNVGTVTSGVPVRVAPVVDTTYTLTVTNSAGFSAATTTRVTLVAAPVATSLWATMNPELYGGSTTITPTFSAGTGSVDQGIGAVTNGVPFSSGPITATKTFTLTVTNSLGTTATKTLTLTPVGVSLGSILPSTPTVTVATSRTFSVLASGGATNTVTWSATGGTITSGGVWTAPASPGTVTITATSADDTTARTSTTVTVVAAPVATSLVASTQTPAYGAPFTLTPTYSAGVATLSNSVICPATGVASGAITANWSGARTYTLTVTNAAGTTATATTTLTSQTVAVAAFTPGAPTVTVGATQAFSTTATGGATNAVTWSSSAGTWSGSAWTAPATAGSVTITATSADDTSKTATTTVTVVPAPTITSFSAAQATITVGASTTLTAVFANGTGAVDNAVGTVATAVAKTVTPTATTTYTLTVTNAAGTATTLQTTVTVVPAPTITNFSAANATLTAGDSTSLTAVFANGTGAVDNAVGTVATAVAKTVTPTATTTYTLTVTNPAGTATTLQTTVTVVPAPVATSLVASTQTPARGATFTLTPTYAAGTGSINNSVACPATGQASAALSADWTGARTYLLTVTNAAGTATTTSVTITPQTVSIGTISPAAPTLTVGTSQAFTASITGGLTNGVTWSSAAGTWVGNTWTTPPTPGSYTLTATSTDDTSKTASCTVTVVAAPSIITFTAAPTTITTGDNASLTAVFANGTGVVDHSVGIVTTTVAKTVTPASTTTYILTVTNTAGTTTTATATVTVVAAPVATSLVATSQSPAYGATFTLTPTYSAGRGVLSHNLACPDSGTATAALNANWTGARTYTLTATNAAATSATTSVTVTPQIVSVAAFSPVAATVTVGASQAFSTTATGGATNAVSWSATGGTWSGSTWTAPATPGTYTITATSADDTSKTAATTVTVVPAPVAYGFVASTASPAYGATFTLTATYEGGVGSIAGNTGPAIACPASGLPSAPITADWSGIRAYTLTITNAAGARDASIVVSVIPQTVAFTGITPATPSVTAGYTQAFTATVTGGVTNTVTWDSNGQGTWSGNTWTAPATAGSVTITATSVDDPTKTYGITATVVAPVPISGTLSAPEGPATGLRSPKLGPQEEPLASASLALPTALPPMGAGITINLIQIDNAGLQVGAVIATCLTDASGSYSLQAPAGFVPGPSHAVQALIPANGSTPTFTLLSFVTSTTANNIDPYTHATFGLVTTSITTGGGTLASLGNGAVLAIQGTVYSNMGNVPSSALTTSAMLTALQIAMTQDEESKNALANLAAPFGITGTVKNLAGEPLAGIGVGVCSFGGLTLMGVTQTAADGTYTVRVPAGDYVVGAMNLGTASFAASGWWSATGPVSSQFKAGKVTVSDAMLTKDFALIAGGRLAGSLTGMANPTDVPLPGMQIALCDFASGQTLASASTGPDGTFVFNVAPGTYYVSVRNKTRYVPYGSANFMDTPPVGTGGGKNSTQATKITVTAGVTQSGSMRLWPGHKISGTVLTNSGGSPVVGIPVRFQDATAGLNTPGAESTRTDVDGQYRLWLQPGNYNALCRGQSATLLNAGVADVVQNFSASVGKITLKLVDSGNHPISQARGDLYKTLDLSGLSQEISNSEGILEMYTTTPAQTVKLGFSIYTNEFFGSSAYNGPQPGAPVAINVAANLVSPNPSAPSLDLGTITLPDGAILTGYVWDTSTPPQGRPNIMVQVRYGGTGSNFKLVNTRTKSDGSYTVTLPAGITLSRVVANPGTTPSQQFDNIVMGVAGTTKTQDFTW